MLSKFYISYLEINCILKAYILNAMQNIFNIKNYLSSVIILTLVIIDQLTKNWVVEYCSLITNHAIKINPILNIVFVKNNGVTFGLFNNIKYGQTIFSIIGIMAIILLIRWMKNEQRKITFIAFNMIISGAIGNVIDRFRWGGVIDFLDFHIKDHHWYSFNIADSVICIGVAILFIDNIINDINKNKNYKVYDV